MYDPCIASSRPPTRASFVLGEAKFRQSRPDKVVFKSSSNYHCHVFEGMKNGPRRVERTRCSIIRTQGQCSWSLKSWGNFERVIPERCAVVVHDGGARSPRGLETPGGRITGGGSLKFAGSAESDARASPESENSLPRENVPPLRVKVETILRMKYTNSPR